jgi:hypothetical protein
MAHSWHDFFYGAFDPLGTVSVDKLPGALWIQALSVRLFRSAPVGDQSSPGGRGCAHRPIPLPGRPTPLWAAHRYLRGPDRRGHASGGGPRPRERVRLPPHPHARRGVRRDERHARLGEPLVGGARRIVRRGFDGHTPVPSVATLRADVASGALHTVLLLPTRDRRAAWVIEHCRLVPASVPILRTYYCGTPP